MTALAAAGAAVSAYLVWVHYAEAEPFCTGLSNCVKVQTSTYAELGGIPVALLGLIGYVAILIATRLSAELPLVVLCLTGFGFSLYLTYLELFEIDAICQWCVISALLMTALAVLSVRAFVREPS